VLHHRGEFGWFVPEAREREPGRRHLGVDLEGAPENFQRDAPGELLAGLLEADRPDEAPRSGVVAEDFDAHDRYPLAHCPLSSAPFDVSAPSVSTCSSFVSINPIIRPIDVSGEPVGERRRGVEGRLTLGDPGRPVVP
jgi:hypothetical protein